MSKKILLAYSTRYGATEETAAAIQETLEKKFNLDVELYKLKEGRIRPDISKYDHVIIGSGIKYGKWCPDALNFLDNDFSNKQVAVYICSGYAGEKELYEHAYNHFLKEVVDEHQVKAIEIEAFGGKVPMTHIPELYFVRVLKRLPQFQIDGRDWTKIEQWAEKLGEIFTKEEE